MNCAGTVNLQCPRMRSKTIIAKLNQAPFNGLRTQMQDLVDYYEGQDYVVLAHSLVDVGAGWMVGLSVGYYDGDTVPSLPTN